MAKYVALLRGIGPGNPNMRNEKLREFFEGLGLQNVTTVISSGNVVFESNITDIKSLETMIEEALPIQLEFSSTTIIRSQDQLQKLVDANPFKSTEHGPKSYLMVTFCKNPPKTDLKLPYQPPGKPYQLFNIVDDTLFSITDTTAMPTTDIMQWLEKQFGKQISSRTLLTVHRILKKMAV